MVQRQRKERNTQESKARTKGVGGKIERGKGQPEDDGARGSQLNDDPWFVVVHGNWFVVDFSLKDTFGKTG